MKSFGFWFGMGAFLFSLILLALNALALPFLWRPVLMILLWLGALCAYFMDVYGIRIDIDMITNLVETDQKEAAELFTLRLLFYLIAIGALPSLLVWKAQWPKISWQKNLSQRLFLAFIAISTLMTSVSICYKDFALFGREHKAIRQLINPFYPIYSASQYLLLRSVKANERHVIAADATQKKSKIDDYKPRIVILVVGETARAEQFGLNGYARNTTPELSKEADLVNFRNVWSCGTSTASSLPCMFSNLGFQHFSIDSARAQDSILDVLHRAGISVLWRDNNSGCKGVCERIGIDDVTTRHDPRYCTGNECFDEILLDQLPEKLRAITHDTLIVLHQKGSHGPAYFKRTPASAKWFKPECTDVNVQNCDRQSIVNAYDNTIAYTDHVLSSAIAILKAQSDHLASAMFYVSDHGESLGENGIYLHGFPYALAPDTQTHIPMIAWLSPTFLQVNHLSLPCLQASTNEKLSHDNLYHSLLGLFDVATQTYDRKLDLFSHCQA